MKRVVKLRRKQKDRGGAAASGAHRASPSAGGQARQALTAMSSISSSVGCTLSSNAATASRIRLREVRGGGGIGV